MLAGSAHAWPPPLAGGGLVLSILLAVYYAACRSDIAIAVFCVVCGSLCATGSAADVGYAVHFYGRGAALVDPLLNACDIALAFDWHAALAFFDAHPWLTGLLAPLYSYCSLQMYVALLVAYCCGQHLRLLALIGINFTVLIIVHCFAFFFPAIGAYGYLGLKAAMHPHVALVSTDLSVAHVLQMRQISELIIPDHPLGLLNFPSYHTAVAVLFGWFFWRSPLRWPALMVNTALIVATVIHGSHYVTDIIAGAAFTTLIIALFCRYLTDPFAMKHHSMRAGTLQPA